DRGVRGFPAGGEARPRRAETVRRVVAVLGPMLVADELLSGAGPGADVARQPGLSGGVHGRDDAQGSQARAGRGQDRWFQGADGCRRGSALRFVCRSRERDDGFFRDHQAAARRLSGRPTDGVAWQDESGNSMSVFVNAALPQTAGFARSIDHSPWQINIILIVLFKWNLDDGDYCGVPDGDRASSHITRQK